MVSAVTRESKRRVDSGARVRRYGRYTGPCQAKKLTRVRLKESVGRLP